MFKRRRRLRCLIWFNEQFITCKAPKSKTTPEIKAKICRFVTGSAVETAQRGSANKQTAHACTSKALQSVDSSNLLATHNALETMKTLFSVLTNRRLNVLTFFFADIFCDVSLLLGR